MNTLTTNIIQNVYNIGTNSCGGGTQYCTEDYSLYFPCLKNITKGQNVCFDFYIADGNTQDVVDLRTVESISLNLNGQFNCSYGTFSYPENIKSLQTEDYSEIYKLGFDDRTLCPLGVFMIDKDTQDILNSIGDSCDSDSIAFYSGTKVTLEAKDTATHIFIGWAKIDPNEEECAEETLEDKIINKSNIYTFTIKEKTVIIALYRKRRKYNVVSDTFNKSSHFIVDYNHIEYYISNRDNDGFDDGQTSGAPGYQYDVLEDVLEGYSLVVTCIPSKDEFDSESDPENNSSFKFVQWKDGNKERCRKFIIGGTGCDGTQYFEDGNTIGLRAICTGPIDGYVEPKVPGIVYIDEFDEEGIHILTDFDEVNLYDYYEDCEYVRSSEEVYKKYIEKDGFLYFNSGKLILSSQGIENGIKIDIHACADILDSESNSCELSIKVNDYLVKQEISSEEPKRYEFYFSKCNKSDIEISTDGNCLIDEIVVYKEVLIDGGKAQFCLDAETTSNIPSGPLSVNGAIAVGELGVDENGDLTVENPEAYGLTTTVIGNVNRIPKITINI